MIDTADTQTVDLFPQTPKKTRGRPATGQAMTNAERQARYRSRQQMGIAPKSDSPRSKSNLNVWVDSYAHFNLDRLAAIQGIKPAALLEKLIHDAHMAYSKSLEIDSPEWLAYYGKD